ncbi:MAG TPA: hypothetical protein VHP33_12265 [Polyangiaceae bacterium]|nr:hypothetical protein [Polyangiaceae bacterium]
MRLLRVLIQAAGFALLVGCAPPPRPAPDLRPQQAAFRARFLRELDSMELERLYKLDPYQECPEGAITFYSVCVTGEREPAAEDRHAGRAHRGLRNLMEATTTGGMSCFDAIHGATFRGAHGSFDVLVSLGCGNYRIYGQSRDEVVGDSFEGAEARPWFAAFEAAGLLKSVPKPPQ